MTCLPPLQHARSEREDWIGQAQTLHRGQEERHRPGHYCPRRSDHLIRQRGGLALLKVLEVAAGRWAALALILAALAPLP